MKVLYRLGYYLGGFSVGLILLAFILNGKKTSCNYTPNARVIDNLLQKKIVISQEVIDQFPQLTDSIVKESIRKGTIDFQKVILKEILVDYIILNSTEVKRLF